MGQLASILFWTVFLRFVGKYVLLGAFVLWIIVLLIPDGESHEVKFVPSMVRFESHLNDQGDQLIYSVKNNTPYYIDTLEVRCIGTQWDTADNPRVDQTISVGDAIAPHDSFESSAYAGFVARPRFSNVGCHVENAHVSRLEKGYAYRSHEGPRKVNS